MIVQCISFGSHWYLKKRFDQRTGALLRHRSAFMNTTHIKVGSPEKYKHSIGGFVRINAATKPYFDSPRRSSKRNITPRGSPATWNQTG